MVEVELTVQLNDEVINVNDDVYLTDFVTTHSLHFSQSTDPKVVIICDRIWENVHSSHIQLWTFVDS